jgi:hypothetical protein
MRLQTTAKANGGTRAFLLIACLDLSILGGAALVARFAEDGASAGMNLAKACLQTAAPQINFDGTCGNEAARPIILAQRLPGSTHQDGRQ